MAAHVLVVEVVSLNAELSEAEAFAAARQVGVSLRLRGPTGVQLAVERTQLSALLGTPATGLSVAFGERLYLPFPPDDSGSLTVSLRCAAARGLVRFAATTLPLAAVLPAARAVTRADSFVVAPVAALRGGASGAGRVLLRLTQAELTQEGQPSAQTALARDVFLQFRATKPPAQPPSEASDEEPAPQLEPEPVVEVQEVEAAVEELSAPEPEPVEEDTYSWMDDVEERELKRLRRRLAALGLALVGWWLRARLQKPSPAPQPPKRFKQHVTSPPARV